VEVRIGDELPVSSILAIAKKEFKESISNRWFLVLSVIFFLLILQIPYIVLMLLGFFSYSNIPGKTGIFLVHAISFGGLITLIVGSLSIVTEKEQDTLSFLLTQPIRKLEIIIGKFFGLLLVISLMMSIGFGLAMLPSIGEEEIINIGFLNFIYSTLVMVGSASVMIGLSIAISVISASRTMAVSLALFIWLFFTLIYGSGFLGYMLITVNETQAYFYFIFLNPIEISNIIMHLILNPVLSPSLPARFMVNYFGIGGAFVPLTIGLLIWSVTPIIFSVIEFYSREY
jgi:Cu-processing system permease protein|tara:strand:+ start:4513 stop:5370 length:858 start_codon:yes stop_codon:yes gene_type:complete